MSDNAAADPYRLFPPATKDEREALKRSIEAVGLQSSVVVDAQGNIIDGHERRDICNELGIDWLKCADVRGNFTEADAKALHVELNLFRKSVHLTRTKRNELIEVYLIAHSHLSNSQIAKLFGVDTSTVNRRRKSLTTAGRLKPQESTLGRDGKRRKRPRFFVKHKHEFSQVSPDLMVLGSSISGVQRRPRALRAKADRVRNFDLVQAHEPAPLPELMQLHNCDFRELPIEPESVDLILTDVVWFEDSQQDWFDLAECSERWLKPNGVFCSIIGNQSMATFFDCFHSDSLRYQLTMNLLYDKPTRSYSRDLIERWRPAVVFAKADSLVVRGICDTIDVPHADKSVHPWQQSLPAAIELVQKLSKPGDLIVDPQLGTGTNAVASRQVGYRRFVGCDIDAKQVKTARYRIDTEAIPSLVPDERSADSVDGVLGASPHM